MWMPSQKLRYSTGTPFSFFEELHIHNIQLRKREAFKLNGTCLFIVSHFFKKEANKILKAYMLNHTK